MPTKMTVCMLSEAESSTNYVSAGGAHNHVKPFVGWIGVDKYSEYMVSEAEALVSLMNMKKMKSMKVVESCCCLLSSRCGGCVCIWCLGHNCYISGIFPGVHAVQNLISLDFLLSPLPRCIPLNQTTYYPAPHTVNTIPQVAITVGTTTTAT